MSIEQTRRAWALPPGKLVPLARYLLLALADLANDAGRAWPSQATIRRLTGISDRHVRNLIPDLVAAHLVVIVTPGTSRSSTVYQLNLPALSTRQPVPDRQPVPGRQFRPGWQSTSKLPAPSAYDPSESPIDPKNARGAADPTGLPAPRSEPEHPLAAALRQATKSAGSSSQGNGQARSTATDPALIELNRRRAADIAARLGRNQARGDNGQVGDYHRSPADPDADQGDAPEPGKPPKSDGS